MKKKEVIETIQKYIIERLKAKRFDVSGLNLEELRDEITVTLDNLVSLSDVGLDQLDDEDDDDY